MEKIIASSKGFFREPNNIESGRTYSVVAVMCNTFIMELDRQERNSSASPYYAMHFLSMNSVVMEAVDENSCGALSSADELLTTLPRNVVGFVLLKSCAYIFRVTI